MTFKDAETEIVELAAGLATLVTLGYTKSIWIRGGCEDEVECQVIICFIKNRVTELFKSTTWQGVIDKLKIHLMPKGEPTPEEAPDEIEKQDEKYSEDLGKSLNKLAGE